MCSNKKYYIKCVVFNVFYHAARAAGEMKGKNNKRAGFTCALLFEMMIQLTSNGTMKVRVTFDDIVHKLQ